MAKKVLVIEDNRDLAGLLALHLRDMGLEVDLSPEGETGLAKGATGKYDLVLLDLMLPDMDGLAVCRRLRERAPYTPILMVTSKDTELDRVLGLEMGADDYVTKPFSFRELMARVKAVLRRVDALREGGGPEEEAVVRVGDVVLDPPKRKASVGGRNLELTAKEFDLLEFFLRRPGRVFTRAQLLDAVWGYGHEGYEHTVNSHINRLRTKIEDNSAHPLHILTVWGVGYKFADPEA